MASTCLDNTLTAYSGTSQAQRALEALSAQYAQVDERTAADLILFAKKYGFYLNYYSLANSISGDWQGLMQKDAAVIIATIADWDTKDFTPFIEYLVGQIKAAAGDGDAEKYFKPIFDLVFTLATAIDKSLQQLPAGINFSTYLTVASASNLSLPLNLLYNYYGDFKAALVDETSRYIDDKMPVDNVVFSQDFVLAPLWQLSSPVVVPPITLSGAIKDKINEIVTHNLFTGALQSFLNGVINIVSQAPSYLDEVMQGYALHQPHYALYLTFLRLFRNAQDHLNEYTKNHLDFYYKTVLQLSNNAAQPDFVHLAFELQKNVDAHILTNGTAFKAGKDASGNDISYALVDDVVLHTAAVQSLKSLYLNKTASSVLYASPVANSEDGNGAKLLSTDGSWLPFGNVKKIAQASIGFAIASNILYLNEGSRVVTFTFACNSTAGLSTAYFAGKFSVQFTGAKALFDPSAFDAAAGQLTCTIINATTFSLSVTVPGNAPAIVPYSAKLHGGSFTVALPMVQLMVTDYTGYAAIKQLNITSITIDVSVNNVKGLSLQSDDGKINPAKPFKPFGEFPDDSSSFTIGSKEIFQKPLTSLTLNTLWQTMPNPAASAYSLVLSEGEWSAPFGSPVNLNTNSISISGLAGIPQSAPDFTANEDYKVTSVDGFIKLQLNSSDFSLSTYISNVQAALSAPSIVANYGDSSHPSNVTSYSVSAPVVAAPPVPPVIKSLSISYSARETILFNELTTDAFNKRTNFYYHLEPFGFREMHPFITTGNLTALPVFDIDNGQPKGDGGELWIGLVNAQPGKTYSMLFQVADGTSNPLKSMATVDWYYMANNNWSGFDKLSLTDQTNNLTRSGIVVVKVPASATTNNTRADNGLLWIKLVVNQDTDAVCKLIAVVNNAAKSTFVQDATRNIYFTQAIPASTISKLVVPDAAIKKTQQPYSSFEGRIRETDDEFYVRVSERLLHKHRAVTAWDYERLVLQYYPQVHKAKCINHTGFITKQGSSDQKYSEVLPGHVTVVTIPDLQNKNAVNPLRPYTSIGLLTEIQQYLGTLTSPFVKLHVVNPQFEEVQFDFSVTFVGTSDDVVYANQLNDEIEQFLTPWAYNTGQDIEFGGKIEKSVVLNFIEERPYVDFVTCFKMNHIISRDGSVITEALYDVEEAVASTARSILVSFYDEEANKKHTINSPAKCDCNG